MSDETFYPGPSRSHLAAFPPKERWHDWTELDSQAWPRRKERHYQLVPTTCFNCESACGLLAYIDRLKGTAKLRPDSKLAVTRDWPSIEARLNGALQLSTGLARVAAAGERTKEAA